MFREDALEIFNAGVDAVKPDRFMPRFVSVQKNILRIGDHQFNLEETRKIIVIGGGKAAAFMAACLEEILGEHIHSGTVVTKEGHALDLKKIECIEAGHPIPDERGVIGANKIKKRISSLSVEDLVICLISGGASALIADVPEGITLSDMRKLNSLLLESGATIQEINTVRKHISTLKGGQLLRNASPAKVISLILSDVVGDPPDIIASGLTAPDPSTFYDAENVLKKYGLTEQMPLPVKLRITAGIQGEVDETPKPGEISAMNILTGSNIQALKAAAAKARLLGYQSEIITDTLEGEASVQAERIVEQALNYKGAKPACLLFGGETTVTIRGNGRGGRNQHFALSALVNLKDFDTISHKSVLILSAGTDGSDGPTDATGAMVDFTTYQTIKEKGLDPAEYHENHDSWHFFQKAGGHIKTGPTYTNVMDIIMVLIK